jgi:hypothetical protein
MTWYAQQVFATPRPDVIAALRALPGLSGHLHHVPHLNEWETSEEVVGAVLLDPDGPKEVPRTIRRGPKLPPGGLIVARELCDPATHAAEWFGQDAVSWLPLAAAGPANGEPAWSAEGDPATWESAAPPASALRAFQDVARSTRTVVSYFTCFMWGGDTELAAAWVWDGERDRTTFYRARLAADADGVERPQFYTDVIGAVAMEGDVRRDIVGGDVLTLALIHHGLMLRDGYFELHTRGFPWEQYRMR